MSPHLLTLPYVGFRPTTPQKEAGCLIEPPVSDPIAAEHKPAATDAALPPELPPGTLLVSQGFEVTPNTDVSVELPMANSSRFVFPKQIPPEDHNLVEAVDSYGDMKFFSILLEHVVATPFVQILSFIAMGIPAKGGSFSPLLINLSIFSACNSAMLLVVDV